MNSAEASRFGLISSGGCLLSGAVGTLVAPALVARPVEGREPERT